jgi:hypothetical protein
VTRVTGASAEERAALSFALEALGIAECPDIPSNESAPVLAYGPPHADVVRAIADRLADRDPPAEPDPFDEHGRLRHGAVATADAPRLEPLVDRLVARLGEWIGRELGVHGIARWPGGASLAVGLSHDVDHPDRMPTLRALAARPLAIRRAPRTLAIRAITDLRDALRGARPGAYWAFDRVVEAEARRGFRSTWFFAATPFHARWGDTFDVAYDVRDARFRSVFDLLDRSGHDLGLHTGYRAHEDPSRIAAERSILSRAAGRVIEGNRHHYWHLGADPAATLRAHDRAGFAYDSSIAFNDGIGLRRSVSLPFHPFDEPGDEPLNLLELPVLAMDAPAVGSTSDVDSALARLERWLAALEPTHGMAVLDWHIQASIPTAGPYHGWGVVYELLLDHLATRPAVWVATLGQIAAWTRDRKAELQRLAMDPDARPNERFRPLS